MKIVGTIGHSYHLRTNNLPMKKLNFEEKRKEIIKDIPKIKYIIDKKLLELIIS